MNTHAYQQLESIFEKIAYLEHLHAMSAWDEAVIMPSGGGKARAKAMATLDGVIHETLTDAKVGELIEQAKEERLDDPWQQANLQWMKKRYLNATCLPDDLVKALSETTLHSEQAWRTLRAENNWEDFAPLLEKTLALTKESAQCRADVFKKSPYDVLLDDFIPGINQQTIDPIFSQLKNTLPDLVETIIEQQKNRPLIQPEGPFPIEQQKQLGLELMQAIGFDFNHGRLDVSHHPFCSGDPEDVRITTRYNEKEFITAAMGTCHETGHARYEQGLPKKWLRQPVGRANSMAIHESQSLLIEMQACRSPEFMNFLSPLVKRIFGEQEAFDRDNLHHLYTTVRRGLIRVDADEVTYPLHVILRYEIEKELIEGDLKVTDLPNAWDEKMKDYFGHNTDGNYKDGVMQDVHWPAGLLGYFPAYTLGSLTAAQLFNSAKKANPQIPTQLAQGNFSGLERMSIQRLHQSTMINSCKRRVVNHSMWIIF